MARIAALTLLLRFVAFAATSYVLSDCFTLDNLNLSASVLVKEEIQSQDENGSGNENGVRICGADISQAMATLDFDHQKTLVLTGDDGCLIPQWSASAMREAFPPWENRTGSNGKWIVSMGASMHTMASVAWLKDLAMAFGEEQREEFAYPHPSIGWKTDPKHLFRDFQVLELTVYAAANSTYKVKIHGGKSSESYNVDFNNKDVLLRFTVFKKEFLLGQSELMTVIGKQIIQHTTTITTTTRNLRKRSPASSSSALVETSTPVQPPPIDLIVDGTGLWYRSNCIRHLEYPGCHPLKHSWEHFSAKERLRDVPERVSSDFRNAMDLFTTSNTTSSKHSSPPQGQAQRRLPPYTRSMRVNLAQGSGESKQVLKEYEDMPQIHVAIKVFQTNHNGGGENFPKHQNHPSMAINLAVSFIWSHIMILKPAVDNANSSSRIYKRKVETNELCSVMDGLGCSLIDAYEKNLYQKKKPWYIPLWYTCHKSQCPSRDSIPDSFLSPITDSTSEAESNAFLPRGTARVYALGTTPEMRWVWILLCLGTLLLFVYYESTQNATASQGHAMRGMGTIRIIASLHVVGGHLQRYGRDIMTPIPLVEFGYTWVPWFMMLSGFILSWATLHRNKAKPGTTDMPWYTFLQRRVIGIYPVYVAGLLATIAVSSKSPKHIPAWRYATDLLLLQAWYPRWTENAIMPHTWFLSAIWPLWALHGCLFRSALQRTTRTLVLWCGLVCAIPTIAFGVLPEIDPSYSCWWCGHVQGRCTTLIDYVVILFKFHPVFYAPTYIAGIASAIIAYRCKRRVEQAQDSKKNAGIILLEFGTGLGMTGIFGLFWLARHFRFAGSKLAFRLGTLLPFHALVLIGLAIGTRRDPVLRISEFSVFSCLGDVSYAQYVFQFVWFHLWRERVEAGFWVWCLGGSVVVAMLVDRPCRRRQWNRGIAGVFATTLFVLMLVKGVRFKVGKDMALELQSSSDTSNQRWINPSVVWDQDHQNLLVAARRHEIRKRDGMTVWRSDVGLGTLDPVSLQLEGNISTMVIVRSASEDNEPCVHGAKKRYAVGQEDPRLIRSRDGVFVTTVVYEKHDEECWARQALGEAREGAGSVLLEEKERLGSSKNWMHITENLFMVNVTSQLVVAANSSTGVTTTVSLVSEEEFAQTTSSLSKKDVSLLRNVHGGSNFVPYRSTVDGEDVWMTVVHTAKRYQNYLIEFEKESPFRIRRISSELPLVVLQSLTNHSYVGGAFASGLVALPPDNGGLLVSYGASDFEARAFRISRSGVAALFSPVTDLVAA